MGDVATDPSWGRAGSDTRRPLRPGAAAGGLAVLALLAASLLAVAAPAAAQADGVVGQEDVTLDDPGADGLGDLGLLEGIGDFLFQPVVDVGGFGLTGLHLVAGVGLAAVGVGAALGAKHVTPDNALEHEGRAALFDTIRSQPGIHLRELAREQDMNVTSATWHLKKLQDVGLIRATKLEGYKVFYPAEGGREARRVTVAMNVLRNDNARRLLRYVADHPGSYQRQIAEAMDLNHATVRWHLQKLKAAGLVTEVPLSSVTTYFLSAEGLHGLSIVEERTPAPVEAAA